jgi:hypothetical protein
MGKKLHPWVDFVYSGRLQIADRHSRLVKLNPTYIQNVCFMDWNWKLSRKEHIRELILKPRQVKVSTAVAALIIGASMCENNLTSVLGNLDENQQKKLWEQKYRTMCDRMLDLETGEVEKPDFDNYSLDRIKFTETGSNIYNEIHNLDLGRGATVQIAHLTEFPFWDKAEPEACLTQLMRCIPDGYPTCVFIESTAAKDGDWFETTFRKSWRAQQKGERSKWSARFFEWWRNEEYQVQRVTREHVTKLKDTLDEEEKYLMESMGTDFNERDKLAKLLWRRDQLEDSDIAEFRKDFPASIDDAFRSKRVSAFDHQSLDWYAKRRIEPDFVGDCTLDLQDKSPIIENRANGPLHMWGRPTVGHEYMLICDVGNEGSKDKTQSYTAMTVLDTNSRRVVATWKDKVNPWTFAEYAYALGKYFNFATLVVERAAGGLAVIPRLVNELAYPNVWASPEKFVNGDESYGFNTSAQSRPQILTFLRWVVRNRVIDIPCTRTQREMENFKENEKGKMKAPKGFNDDLVMALAIGCWLSKNESWVPRSELLSDRPKHLIEAPKATVRALRDEDDIEMILSGHKKRSAFGKYIRG